MGMFDKDKEIGILLVNWVEMRQEFILWEAHIIRDDFQTELGPTAQAGFTVSRLTDPNNRYEVTSLASAIADKVREADPDDFPAIVYWHKVPSRFKQEATVLQFVKPYQTLDFSRLRTDRTPAPVPDDIREAADAFRRGETAEDDA